MDILALIPARGGSKGILRKNLVEVAGRPLLEWTVKPALQCLKEGVVNRVVLSTEDDEIAKVGAALGVEVPFLRPAEFAGDQAMTVDVVCHALEFFHHQGQHFDAVLLLQPTSPLRTAEDIENAVCLFGSQQADSLISVCREDRFNPLILYHRQGKWAMPLDARHNQGVRRQDIEPVFLRNGAIYMTQVDYLLKQRRLISKIPLLFEMPPERSLNLDTMADLEKLRCILAK